MGMLNVLVWCFSLTLINCIRVGEGEGSTLDPAPVVTQNWKYLEVKIRDIAQTIGEILIDSQEICVRLERVLILNDEIECFNYTISNVTHNLYEFYNDTFCSNNTWNLPNLFYFTEKFDEFHRIDYYLFLKCTNLLLQSIVDDRLVYFIEIVENVMRSNLKKTYNYSLAKKVYKILYDLNEDFAMVSEDLVVSSWHPFQSNVSGFSMCENGSLAKLHRDQSINRIDVTDVKMAGLIPFEFLNELTSKSRSDEKLKLRILMLFTTKGSKFGNIFGIEKADESLIGLAVPGFCKNTHLPMLKAYFKLIGDDDGERGKWINFGAEYLDSLVDFDWYNCILNQMCFFAQRKLDEKPYESTKEKYCMSSVIGTVPFEQTSIKRWIYPKKFCMNEKLKIPIAYCSREASYTLSQGPLSCGNFVLSNTTTYLYDLLRNCVMKGKCNKDIFLRYKAKDIGVLVDSKLYFELFIYFHMNEASAIQIKTLCDVFGRSLEILATEARGYYKTGYLSTFLLYFLFSLPQNLVTDIIHGPNYEYQQISSIRNNVSMGSVLYLEDDFASRRLYKTLQISRGTSLHNYEHDNKVVAIVYYVQRNNQNEAVFDILPHLNIFFLYDNFLIEDDNYYCASRIIAIHHNSRNNETFTVTIYLKDVDNGERYWTKVESDKKEIKLVFIRAFRVNKTRELVAYQAGSFAVLENTSNFNTLNEKNGVGFSFRILIYFLLLICLVFIILLDICLYY